MIRSIKCGSKDFGEVWYNWILLEISKDIEEYDLREWLLDHNYCEFNNGLDFAARPTLRKSFSGNRVLVQQRCGVDI